MKTTQQDAIKIKQRFLKDLGYPTSVKKLVGNHFWIHCARTNQKIMTQTPLAILGDLLYAVSPK